MKFSRLPNVPQHQCVQCRSSVGNFMDEFSENVETVMVFSKFQTKPFLKNRLHFFQQCLSRRFFSSKMLLCCPKLYLVRQKGNLIRKKCQCPHICMDRPNKKTQLFSNQFSLFLLSSSQPTIFYLQKVVGR